MGSYLRGIAEIRPPECDFGGRILVARLRLLIRKAYASLPVYFNRPFPLLP